LRILIYHPVRLPVSHYGGTERVLLWLAKTLAKFGHRVAVFAAPGSSLPDPIECIVDPNELAQRINNFDLIHSFTKLPPEWEEKTEGRLVFTIHGNGQAGERFHRNTVFLSRNHAKRHGASVFVYNGIDPDELIFRDSPRADRFLFLSKTSLRTKNLKGAMALAERYHQNLWIAGGERPFSARVKTAWKQATGADWRWVGSIDQKQKAGFLVEGKALVFPLLWNEPFGLVMVEALASGTPVLANPHGSVPEVLAFAPECVLHSEEEWKNALTGGLELPSPKRCREWALSAFHQEVMTRKYLELYERVASGEPLSDTEPVTRVLAEEI
jgi:glycosyltransferase involved in cell wall biosynthesis